MGKLLASRKRPIAAELSASASWKRFKRFRGHIVLLALALVLGMTVAGSRPALSGLPYGGDVVTATSFGSTVTVRRPASVTTGDVLIASVGARLSGTEWINPPSGWNLIRRDSNAPGYLSLTQALYYKVTGSTEPSNYSWSLASPASAAVAILDQGYRAMKWFFRDGPHRLSQRRVYAGKSVF